MAVIEEKGIYNRPNTIIPCESTVSTIINVLLDHRLMSEITDNIYDVPDATQV